MVCLECGRSLPEGPPCLHCLKTIDGGPQGQQRSSDQEDLPDHRVTEALTPSDDTTRTDSFRPGTLFAGRYRIVHRLGRGGGGEVFRAEDVRLRQTIALKFLAGSIQDDAWAFDQFREEARLARRVSHSGVCRIFDFGEAEGLAYVAMEHIEGENLASLRQRVGRLSPERALEVSLEICHGLGAIHELGIIHRDLKPGNIMLDLQGRARILDFGLAALTDVVEGDDIRSGTPAYMAPEQAAGLGVSVRSDLYSLGLVLWELWTGERLGHRERQNPPRISSGVEGVDPAIDRIVLRCLALKPEQRPASAASVSTGLQEAGRIASGPALRTVVAFDALPVTSPEWGRDLLESFGAQEVWDEKGCLWLFEHPWDGVSCAVAIRAFTREREQPDATRLAVEVTTVELRARRPGEPGSSAVSLDSEDSAPLARALVALARPGQTLLSGEACHLARKGGRIIEGGEELSWLSHGRYRMSGSEEPVEVFEVGVEGRAPLEAPESTEASPLVPDLGMVTGWRPAPGTSIPGQPNFRIERRLGEGGYGEAWLVCHRQTGVRQVFKFCFDASHLRGLRREITLFRLLKEELGDRDDIARVLGWNLDKAPFFIQSEYTVGGDLGEWVEDQGGVDKVPLEQRLEIIAQVADALAAAHSVGVLHKDVKPSNILITAESGGGFKARLADFGVGLVTDKERLEQAGITRAGWTTLGSEENDDSGSGTRLYQAPEVLEGRPATLQADVYALGVVLYQLVVGDLGRAVAPGWRDGIDDPLLIEDLTATLHGDSASRLQSTSELAFRLRSLEERRAEEERLRRLEQAAHRRKIYGIGASLGLFLMVIMAALTAWALHEKRKEAEARQKAEEARLESEQAQRESERTTDFLVDLFDIADPYSSWAEVDIPSLTAGELLEKGVGRLESAFEDEPRIQARLLTKLGGVFKNWGETERAESFMERGLEIRRKEFGPGHLEVADSLAALGYLKSGRRPRESEPMLRSALAIRLQHLPPDHLDIAESQLHLALNLRNLSMLVEAEDLARKSLATRRLSDGEDYWVVAASLIGLADILQAQGIYEEVEILYQEALDIQRRVLGAEHLSVSLSIRRLASNLLLQGAFGKAESRFREALDIMRRKLGDRAEEHRIVAMTMNDLARLLRRKGAFAESESHYRKALAIYHRLEGEEGSIAVCKADLALVLAEQGTYTEALRLIRGSLETRKEVFGESSIDVAIHLNNLASVSYLMGDYAEAESFGLESLNLLRSLAEKTHPGEAVILNGLGNVYRAQGAYKEAESQFRESLEILRQVRPPGHLSIANTLTGLARVLIDVKDFGQAEEEISDALAIYRNSLLKDHWKIAYAESLEADIWTALGRFEEAEAVFKASIANVEAAKGMKSRSVHEILERMSTLYEAWNKPLKAAEYRSYLADQ